jgi:hypothetical protein
MEQILSVLIQIDLNIAIFVIFSKKYNSIGIKLNIQKDEIEIQQTRLLYAIQEGKTSKSELNLTNMLTISLTY